MGTYYSSELDRTDSHPLGAYGMFEEREESKVIVFLQGEQYCGWCFETLTEDKLP